MNLKSVAVGKIWTFVAVLSFASAFAYALYFVQKDKGQIFKKTPSHRVKRVISRGEEFFHHGGYGAIKNKNLKESCDFPNLADSLICEEGYFYVIMLKKINKVLIDKKTLGDYPLELKSISQAMGVGVALSVLGKLPTDAVFENQGAYIRPVYDAWGQNQALLNRFEGLGELCRFSRYNKYCMFGIGRSLFLYAPKLISYQDSPWIKKGYDFAIIFAGAVEVREANSPHEVIAQTLRFEPDGDSSEAYRCIRKRHKHVLDCK